MLNDSNKTRTFAIHKFAIDLVTLLALESVKTYQVWEFKVSQ